MAEMSGRVPWQMMMAEHLLMFPCQVISPVRNLRVSVGKVVARYSFHQPRLCKACDTRLGAFGWLLETHQHALGLRRRAGLCMKLELKKLDVTTRIEAVRKELLPEIHVLISSY